MSNFCHNPFVGLDIHPNGQIRPCCKFLKSEIPYFNIQDGIDKYKSSEWLKSLQNQFLNGQKPKGCERCWKEEETGILSKRQMDHDRYSGEFNNEYLKKTKFINISVAFGNLCNIACRICGPKQSSRWASEKKKEGESNYQIFNWYKNPRIMKDIWQSTLNAIHIDIPGGEPLLTEINEHFEYLENFVETGREKQVSLHYTTNGTIFPKDKNIAIWKKFKEIDLQISIDGTKNKFEYNRWPARWDEVYTNIKKYQKLSKDNPNIRLSISHSISVFTILYADQFFKWCIREGLPAPWTGLVSTPEYYNPAVLPKEVKKKLSTILDQSTIKEVRKLKYYLQYDNSKYFNQFLSVTRQLDTIRNQNFQTTFPELAELIRHYI